MGVSYVPLQGISEEEQMNHGTWVAKCNINGKSVKRTFSVKLYGYDEARQQAIQARKIMLAEKEVAESNAAVEN